MEAENYHGENGRNEMFVVREYFCKANVIYGLNDGLGYLHCNPCHCHHY